MRFSTWFVVGSRGGSCRWSSRRHRRCMGSLPAGSTPGVWRRIHDALRDQLRVRSGRDRCPTAAIIDSQTVPGADTVPRSRRGWDGGKRTNGVKRHVAVDVTGLLLGVVVTAASIQDRDAAHRLLAALRGSFSTHPTHLGRRRLPWTTARLVETRSRPSGRDHQTPSRQHRIPRTSRGLGGRAHLRLDRQAPSVCPRLRESPRPPRGRHSHRHDRCHDPTPRADVTSFRMRS